MALNPHRWIFNVQVLHKPGTLASAAAVFSNRGVSLEGILGNSAVDASSGEDGRLILGFQATPEKMALLRRTLERLPSVFRVEAYRFEDERLRAIAVIKLLPQAKLTRDDEDYSLKTLAQTESDRMVMLTGRPPAVEEAIAEFRKQKQLKEVLMSYVAV